MPNDNIYIHAGSATRIVSAMPALGVRACFTTGDRYGITRVPVACWTVIRHLDGTVYVSAMLAWKSTKPIDIDDMPSEYSFVGYDQSG